MRVDIVHPGAGELQYEIRGIVEFAHKLEQTGLPIAWENIGDPIAKGELVPDWIQEIVAQAAKDSFSYAYSPTKGIKEARDFLSKLRTEETGSELSAENIIFFNGLGDAITKTYTWLNPVARVLGPSPAYPTHSSVEGAHGRSRHLTYNLNPLNSWLPDMEDIRNKVKYNPNIAALLIINPDNPTGTVYPKKILNEFIAIAEEYDLFLIADEIYANLAYDGVEFVSLASMIRTTPTIIMRGLSKEVPWPGSRCGWLEFYNIDKDPAFKKYAASLEEAKMIEVCSTTLPQTVLPKILADDRYKSYVRNRTKRYQQRAKLATEMFKNVPGANVVQPRGAFYLTITLGDEVLKGTSFAPYSADAESLLQMELQNISAKELDKLFCYKLLASTGICTVPLTTGFNSHVPGLRMTLLESDEATFINNLKTIINLI